MPPGKQELLQNLPQNGIHKEPSNEAVNLRADRSEEVQEVLNKMPDWIITRGFAAICLIIVLLFIGACVIRYPDVVKTRVSIISSTPPVRLVAAVNGRIQKIFVSDNQFVKPGDTLCMFQNTASYHDVVLLNSIIGALDTNSVLFPSVMEVIIRNDKLNVGEMQSEYGDLYRAVSQYLYFRNNKYSEKAISQLKKQVHYYNELNQELGRQQALLNSKLEIEKIKFDADSTLAKDHIIAPLEMNNTKKQYLDQKLNAEANKANVIQNMLQTTEYEKNITAIQREREDLENELTDNIRRILIRLKSSYAAWEQKYLLISPVEGKVVFFEFWKENQHVQAGNVVVVVAPPVESFVARASLPIEGSGKVKTGQQVKIKLAQYPFQEFGLINAEVTHISPATLDSTYSLGFSLKNQLITTMNKKLPAQAQYFGTAEILTSNKSIMERIFERLIAIKN